MNFRQMLGLIVLALGVVVVVFGFHSIGLISTQKHSVSVITNSPLSPTEHLPEKGMQHRTEILWVLLGGIGLVIVGTCVTVCYTAKIGK